MLRLMSDTTKAGTVSVETEYNLGLKQVKRRSGEVEIQIPKIET